MRTTVRSFVVAAAVLLLAPQASAAAPTITSALTVAGGSTHSMLAETVSVSGMADFGGATFGTAPRTQVFVDPTIDGEVLLDATPPYQDLVAGYIEEVPKDILFTWEVVDLPDRPLYVPALPAYFWEFNLAGADFSVRAQIDARGRGVGSLEANCVTNNNLTQCSPVPGAQVVVTYDGTANTVTAAVRRTDLKANDGSIVGIREGANLIERDLFQGIGAYSTAAGLLTSGLTGDQADMNLVPTYTLGRHVEGALIPAETPDVFWSDALAPPQDTSTADSAGAFTVDLPLFTPGQFIAVARACVGGSCGPVVASDPITVTE